MKSAPRILILLALLLLYGTALAGLRGDFGLKEVTFQRMLPSILIISAIRIWKAQHGGQDD